MEPMQQGTISIVNLPGTGSLLSRTWTTYHRLRTTLLSLSLGLAVSFIVYIGITSLLNFFVKDASHSTQAFIQIVNNIVQFASAFAYAYFFTAMLYVIKHRNETVLTMKEALAKAKMTYKSLLWIGILTGLAVYGGIVGLVLPLLMSVWYYFAVYILVGEGVRGMDAMNKSRYLTRGLWFANLGRYLLLTTIMGLVALFIYLMLAIPAAGGVVFLVLFAAFGILAIPFFAVYDYLRYEDLISVPRTQAFQPFKGERFALGLFATIGLILMTISWVGSLLTCAQRTAISNTAQGSTAGVVIVIAQYAGTNMYNLETALNKIIYTYHPDACPIPPKTNASDLYIPSTNSGGYDLNSVDTTPSNGSTDNYNDYSNPVPVDSTTPTNP